MPLLREGGGGPSLPRRARIRQGCPETPTVGRDSGRARLHTLLERGGYTRRHGPQDERFHPEVPLPLERRAATRTQAPTNPRGAEGVRIRLSRGRARRFRPLDDGI